MPSTIVRVHASAERGVLVRRRPRVDVDAARLLASVSSTVTRAARNELAWAKRSFALRRDFASRSEDSPALSAGSQNRRRGVEGTRKTHERKTAEATADGRRRRDVVAVTPPFVVTGPACVLTTAVTIA